jgi:hypothetical protein
MARVLVWASVALVTGGRAMAWSSSTARPVARRLPSPAANGVATMIWRFDPPGPLGKEHERPVRDQSGRAGLVSVRQKEGEQPRPHGVVYDWLGHVLDRSPAFSDPRDAIPESTN